jgi:hypothetical protein
MTQIALIDDGELQDVQAILDELGVSYLRWHKGEPPPPSKVGRLLITTPAYAVAFGYRRAVERRPDRLRARWVVVTDNDSQSVRKKLMNGGFDTFVCRPVHPAALLTLLHEALFAGDERRIRRRVIVGSEVTVRAGRRSIRSILIDAGARGCRLLSEESLPRGAKVSVQFPKSIAGRNFWHEGVVVRSHGFETAALSGVDLGVRFDPFSKRNKELMLGVLTGHREGPCSLRGVALAWRSGRDDSDSLRIGVSRERKRAKRAIYESEIGIDGFADFSLAGRDLSVRGLRVAPHEALTLGAQLRLELNTLGDEPVLIDAQVTRLDGERGTILTFDWVDRKARARMASFVDELPPIWCGSPDLLDDDDADTVPTLTDTLGRLVSRVFRTG